MFPSTKTLLVNVGTIGIMVGAFFLLTHPQLVGFESFSQSDVNTSIRDEATTSVTATAPIESIVSTTSAETTATDKTLASKQATSASITPKKEVRPALKENTGVQSESAVERVQNPYSSPPQTFSLVNEEARAALVNILCAARSGSLRPVSGSGVIIDPRGVILTNAHVAQYVLLASDSQVDLTCVIRSGSPARPHWSAEVLYIPAIWVKEHASDLNTEHPLGTGEHDYALLRINSAIDGSQFPASFPFLSPDIREAIGFINDPVLAASYPAEFVGGIATQLEFYPASSVTTIKSLLTFANKTVDLVAIGGVIEAQSGSSGGALVNAWGRLIGVITTTSEGTTTAQRDLRSVSLSYINRDLSIQSGFDLPTILVGNIEAQASAFNTTNAPELIRLLVNQIPKPSF